MIGTCNGTIFWVLVPLGPWGGAKRSNIIKSQLLSQFQRFLNQTLCVFSQMIDIKHIRWDFHLTAWVMPPGVGLWGLGLSKKNLFSEIQPELVCELQEWHMQQHKFLCPPPPGALGRGQRSNIIKSQLLSHLFQIFINQTLCVISQMKDIKYIRQDFH